MNPSARERPDWSAIDTVLLDMDGTILDLKFDNHFWLEVVPAHYAAAQGLALEAAKAQLNSHPAPPAET